MPSPPPPPSVKLEGFAPAASSSSTSGAAERRSGAVSAPSAPTSTIPPASSSSLAAADVAVVAKKGEKSAAPQASSSSAGAAAAVVAAAPAAAAASDNRRGRKRRAPGGPVAGSGSKKKGVGDDDNDPAPTLEEIRTSIGEIRAGLPSVLPPIPPPDALSDDAYDDDGEVEFESGGGGGGVDGERAGENGEVRHGDDEGAAAVSKENERRRVRAVIRTFASSLQVAVEQFNLLLSLVSPATYRWGVDRSGAAHQSLAVMSAELQQCQETIGSVVSPRLANVLCPAVDIVVREVRIRRWGDEPDKGVAGAAGGGDPGRAVSLPQNERRTNVYARRIVDSNYRDLCLRVLARNASMIRRVVASALSNAARVIGDYLESARKDSSDDVQGRGYAY